MSVLLWKDKVNCKLSNNTIVHFVLVNKKKLVWIQIQAEVDCQIIYAPYKIALSDQIKLSTFINPFSSTMPEIMHF